jgi:hypothetical protein
VRDGIARREPVLVAVQARNLEGLHSELGEEASAV